MPKVGFVSLGCPKNLVDSEVMMGILARDGCELTPRADEAKILVVNTCSFIESGQKESVDAILEMADSHTVQNRFYGHTTRLGWSALQDQCCSRTARLGRRALQNPSTIDPALGWRRTLPWLATHPGLG